MRRLIPLACAAVVLAVPAARATVALDLSVPELTQRADVVVRGTVVDQKVGWDELHRHPVTKSVVQVKKALKGAAKTVVVRQVGGDLDGLHLHIPGDTSLKVGEEVVLFAQKLPGHPGEFVIEGMSEGKFTVLATAKGEVVTRSLHGLALARPGANGLVRVSAAPPKVPARLSYQLLLRGVKAGLDLPPVAPLALPAGAARMGR